MAVLWNYTDALIGNGPNGNEVPVTRFIGGQWYTFWPSGGYGSTAFADTINMADVYYANQFLPSSDGYYIVSSANPHSGTYHLRAAPDYDTFGSNAGPAFTLGSEVINGNTAFVGYTAFPIVAGDYTMSLYAMQSGSAEPENEAMNRVVRLVNINTNATINMHSDSVPYPMSYTELTYGFTITDQHVLDYTHFLVNFDWQDQRFTEPIGESRVFDVDNIVLTGPDAPVPTLFWTNTGFRFPYQRWD